LPQYLHLSRALLPAALLVMARQPSISFLTLSYTFSHPLTRSFLFRPLVRALVSCFLRRFWLWLVNLLSLFLLFLTLFHTLSYSFLHFFTHPLTRSFLFRPLVRALVNCFLRRFWFVPLFKFFGLICVFVNPFLLRTLIGSVKNGTTALSGPVLDNVWQVAALLFFSTMLKATLDHRGYWCGLRCGLSVCVFLLFIYLRRYS
jgi:hypothetical protein